MSIRFERDGNRQIAWSEQNTTLGNYWHEGHTRLWVAKVGGVAGQWETFKSEAEARQWLVEQIEATAK